MKFSIVKFARIFYIFSSLLALVGLAGIVMWGLKLGIEFTGGSALEVTYAQVRPPVVIVNEALKGFNMPITSQPIGDLGMLLKFKEVDEATHQAILAKLGSIFLDFKGNETLDAEVAKVIKEEERAAFSAKTGQDIVREEKFESIGPVVGQELIGKSVWALILVMLFIAFYISWAFRRAVGFVRPWHYGAITLLKLSHDVIVTVGLFAFLGHFAGVEIGASFIAAVLTVVGYSVHDNVVVFDRIRENITRLPEKDFGKLVDVSLFQTFARSINTSLTVLLVLGAISIFGGESLRYFTLALLVGIAIGTYSSIFVASPLLVTASKILKGQ